MELIWNYAEPGSVFSSALLVDRECHTDSLDSLTDFISLINI